MAEEEDGNNIIQINIEDEMRVAYIDYSMSVIVSRALPDVRDGLKPVHRRVLYGMQQLGLYNNRPHRKSARIVGDVLGKYHPHGDTSVYDAMVRMAQSWSLRYPLVDGQGNFGSIDGDSPAAMRYTEARLRKIAEEMLVDIDKETVDFQENYDGSDSEPVVLPAKIPNLLLNGASGIAVGMATNLAPHNISEVVDGLIAYIDNREISNVELNHYITGPDFPTGSTIYGIQGIRSAYETGRGRIVLRANSHFDTLPSGKEQIIFDDVPYMLNKANMIKQIANMVNERKIEGISDLRDESDKEGIRVVFDLRKDAMPNIVLNTLYKLTPLQNSFGVNNVALVKGRPETLSLKALLHHYVEHRHEVVVRRTKFDLRKAEERAHILEGLLIALDHLDEIIQLIRNSRDPEVAREALMSNYELSERQARAILDMRLQRLTNMERDKIRQEYEEIKKLIDELRAILADEGKRMQIIKDELLEMKDKYGDERRTDITMSSDDISVEDLIADEAMVLTISHNGYIKRTPLQEYRVQGRGGVGARGVATKGEDFTEHLFIATAHKYLLIFTEYGKLYWIKVYQIPEGTKTSQGRAIQNLINIENGDSVRTVIPVENLEDPDYIHNNFLVFCTEQGLIKKTPLEAYSRPRSNGINAININPGDRLFNVKLTDGDSHVLLAKRSGKVVRFPEDTVRSMGRMATGVRAIALEEEDDRVVGVVALNPNKNPDYSILIISEHGYGKRGNIDEYRSTNRGAKGVKALNITEKTGKLVRIMAVHERDDIMIINRSGITIRMAVEDIRLMGRNAQGVRLLKINEDDMISSVARIEIDEEVDQPPQNGQGNHNDSDTDQNPK